MPPIEEEKMNSRTKPTRNPNAGKQTAVNPAIAAIVAEGFLSRLSFGLISFTLPLYAYHLGMSLTQIGLLISFEWMVALALKPITGWIADRIGLKRGLTIAIGMRTLVALGLAFAGVPWQLFVIRGLHGASKALRDPSASALIAVHGGKQAIGSSFAWYLTAKSVAGSLGQTLAGILLTVAAGNYDLVFFVACLLSLLPLHTVRRWVKPAPAAADESSNEFPPARENDSDPQTLNIPNASQPISQKEAPALLPYAFLGFLITGTADLLRGIFPILATEYAGLSAAQAGMIYTASTAVNLIAGPLFGWLADRVSGKFVLAIRGVANTVSSIFYLVSPEFSGVAAGKLIDDAGKAAFRPAWGLMMSRIAEATPSRRAQMMSLMSMGEDAGGILGPILAGFLWTTWGVPFLFAARILLAIVTELYAIRLFRRSEAPALIHSRTRQAQVDELMKAARLAIVQGNAWAAQFYLKTTVQLDPGNQRARLWLAVYSGDLGAETRDRSMNYQAAKIYLKKPLSPSLLQNAETPRSNDENLFLR